MEYLEAKYVVGGIVERREYQVNLARQAGRENCIIVLPTGLGKTAIALQVIADFLAKGTGGSLFLAPTRVLVNQHYNFLKEALTISDLAMITGGDTIKQRKMLWGNSVVCATPEITKNDLDRQLVSPSQFNLVIFDEAHRTVGDYAYSGIAERVAHADARIVGMTATLPSEMEKATDVMKTLRTVSIAQRTEESDDVKPYVQETETNWVMVELPGEIAAVQTLVKKALDQRYDQMRRNGVSLPNRSLSALLKVRNEVISRNVRSAKPLFTAIRITYALNILEVHGVTPFLKFCDRTSKKSGAGIRELFNTDPNFTRAVQLAKLAQSRQVEHPKVPKLVEILGKHPGKVLIFTSYRDSVEMIRTKLADAGIVAGILIGKAGETGLRREEQVEAVERFRNGEYRVLIATRVGEEGLDIAEVGLVIFYDNVPSSIRYVQRKGRTGRKDSGRLIVLIAKGTIDETYHWMGVRKVKTAKSMGARMNRSLKNSSPDASKMVLDGYF